MIDSIPDPTLETPVYSPVQVMAMMTKPVICYYCGLPGHKCSDCRKRKQGLPPITAINWDEYNKLSNKPEQEPTEIKLSVSGEQSMVARGQCTLWFSIPGTEIELRLPVIVGVQNGQHLTNKDSGPVWLNKAVQYWTDVSTLGEKNGLELTQKTITHLAELGDQEGFLDVGLALKYIPSRPVLASWIISFISLSRSRKEEKKRMNKNQELHDKEEQLKARESQLARMETRKIEWSRSLKVRDITEFTPEIELQTSFAVWKKRVLMITSRYIEDELIKKEILELET